MALQFNSFYSTRYWMTGDSSFMDKDGFRSLGVQMLDGLRKTEGNSDSFRATLWVLFAPQITPGKTLDLIMIKQTLTDSVFWHVMAFIHINLSRDSWYDHSKHSGNSCHALKAESVCLDRSLRREDGGRPGLWQDWEDRSLSEPSWQVHVPSWRCSQETCSSPFPQGTEDGCKADVVVEDKWEEQEEREGWLGLLLQPRDLEQMAASASQSSRSQQWACAPTVPLLQKITSWLCTYIFLSHRKKVSNWPKAWILRLSVVH